MSLILLIFFSLAAKLIGPRTGVNSLKTADFSISTPLRRDDQRIINVNVHWREWRLHPPTLPPLYFLLGERWGGGGGCRRAGGEIFYTNMLRPSVPMTNTVTLVIYDMSLILRVLVVRSWPRK